MKRPSSITLFALILVISFWRSDAFSQAKEKDKPELTTNESSQARSISSEFAKRLTQTNDLGAIAGDLFMDDYIERLVRAKSEEATRNSKGEALFAPGLFVVPRLLSEAGPDDWRRFYLASHNFIFFGFLSAAKMTPDEVADLKPADLYPAKVISLLSQNPNLSDLIEKKKQNIPITSVDQMKKATLTLELVNSQMRENLKGKPPINLDDNELIKAMRASDLAKPRLIVSDEPLFSLPRRTRIVMITSPVLFDLAIVKINGKFKIVSAEPFAGD